MSNSKSFVFNTSGSRQSLVLPSEGRYHLYISHDGQVQVIDHKGRVILQRSSGSGSSPGVITTNDVVDYSYMESDTLTETLNAILDSITNLGTFPVNSVNGEQGDVILTSDDIDTIEFFVFSIAHDIINGLYRKDDSGLYQRIDVGPGAGEYMTTVSGFWTVFKANSPQYQAQIAGPIAPTDVTSWNYFGGGSPLAFSMTPLYSGATQIALEQLAQKLDEQSVMVYGDRFVETHLETIYTASTTSGNWTIYPTNDQTSLGTPLFQELLWVFPSSFNSTFPVINLQNVSMLSGSCYSMPGGSAAPNGTTVKVLMKGIRA